jgi:hypothetical protein
MLAQLSLLMLFQLIGEALVTSTGIPFPGPLFGDVAAAWISLRAVVLRTNCPVSERSSSTMCISTAWALPRTAPAAVILSGLGNRGERRSRDGSQLYNPRGVFPERNRRSG